MTTSEKFCLKWNDFQENVTTSFKEIRAAFCDVTLIGEGNVKIEAHKVILAASSYFFRDLLRQNPHPNPLLYMRGIKDDQMSSLVDFMYHGETNVAQDDLEDFLKVAQELQIKGLAGTEENELKNDQTVKPRKKLKIPMIIPLTPKEEDCIPEAINQTIVGKRANTAENKDLVAYDDRTETRIATTDVQLADTINSIMHNIDGIWSCSQCGKRERDKSNLKKHIEAKHIEGVYHPCNQCGKQFRSKNTLYKHTSTIHKQARHNLTI